MTITNQSSQTPSLRPFTLCAAKNFLPLGFRREELDSVAGAMESMGCASDNFWIDIIVSLWGMGFTQFSSWLGEDSPNRLSQGAYLFRGWLLRHSGDFFSVAITAKGSRNAILFLTLVNHGATKLYQVDVLEASVRIPSATWKRDLSSVLDSLDQQAKFIYDASPKCPKCNAMMIQKIMKLGIKGADGEDIRSPHPHENETFFGCANYPNCRGMRATWIPEDQAKEVGDIAKDLTCPKCGNAVVVRQARRGRNKGNKFFGCINYPKCDGLVTMEEAVAKKLMS